MGSRVGVEYHASKWRSVTLGRGGFWGFFRRDWDDVARRLLTRSGSRSRSRSRSRSLLLRYREGEFAFATSGKALTMLCPNGAL